MSGLPSAGETVLFSQGDGAAVPVESRVSGQGTIPTGLSVMLWSHTGTAYPLAAASPDELANQTGLANQNGMVALSTAPEMPGATAAEVTPDGSDIGVVINSDNLLDGGAVPSGPMPFTPSWTPASPVMPFAEASDQTLIASLDLQVPYAQSAAFGDSASSAQIVLYFGLTDTKTFRTMAIGMSIFDSRGTSSLDIGIDNGPGGTGALYVVQPAGQSSPYDVVVPGAAQFAGAPWTGERHFAFEITPGTLSHLISVVNANAPPGQQFSTNLADYQLTNVSVDAELEYFGQSNSIGFSMSNFQVAEATQPTATTPGPTIAASPATQPPALLLGGAAGGDTLLAGSGNTTLVGSQNELLVGGPGFTTIFPGGGHNTIFGGLGGSAVTTIAAGTGNDMIIAGGGTQIIFTGSGADTVWGSADPSAQVVMVGGSGPALFVGGSGADQMWAGGGSQTLMGGGGDQLLVAGPGSTTMLAGGGHDLMFGGPAGSAAAMFGGPASAVMVSEAGADTIVAGTAGDSIFGGVGGDAIKTGSGADTVVLSPATARPDTIYLGRGDAAVFGGASPDTYIVTFGQAGGHDVISGFRPGTDHLVFPGYGGAAPLVEQIAAGTLIALSDGTQILLAGVSLSPDTVLS